MWEAIAGKAVGDLAGGLGKGLGAAFGDSGPFMGGSAEAATYGTTLDGSGWIVNLGGQQIASASPTRTAADFPAATPVQAGIGGMLPLIAFGAAAVFFLLRRRGRR